MSSERKDRSGGGSRKSKSVPDRGVMVPLDSWSRLIDQLGNLHVAGRDLAEARERAAKAETEVTFLRERLRDAHERIRQLEMDARREEQVLLAQGTPSASGTHADAPRSSHAEAGPGQTSNGSRSPVERASTPATVGAPPGPAPRANGAGYSARPPARQIPSPPQIAARFRRWWHYVDN